MGSDPRVETRPGDGLAAHTSDDALSPLESGYRRWLRVLPAAYREMREQAMVDAFVRSRIDADPELADATVQSSWPGLREAASVVALALRLRWADPGGPRRYAVSAAGLRLATLTGLTVLAVTAVTSLLGTVLLVLEPPSGVNLTAASLLFGRDPGLWSLLRGWSYLLWIPALVLSLAPGRRGASWAVLLAGLPVAVGIIATISLPAGPNTGGTWVWVLVQVAVVAGLTAMAATPPESSPSSEPTRRPARALRSLLAVAVVLLLVWLAAFAGALWSPALVRVTGYTVVDSSGQWCLAAVVVTATMAVHRARGGRRTAAELLGLALVAGAASILRIATLPLWFTYAGHGAPGSAQIVASALIQLGLAVVITCLAGGLTTRRLHRLPPVSYRPVTT